MEFSHVLKVQLRTAVSSQKKVLNATHESLLIAPLQSAVPCYTQMTDSRLIDELRTSAPIHIGGDLSMTRKQQLDGLDGEKSVKNMYSVKWPYFMRKDLRYFT